MITAQNWRLQKKRQQRPVTGDHRRPASLYCLPTFPAASRRRQPSAASRVPRMESVSALATLSVYHHTHPRSFSLSSLVKRGTAGGGPESRRSPPNPPRDPSHSPFRSGGARDTLSRSRSRSRSLPWTPATTPPTPTTISAQSSSVSFAGGLADQKQTSEVRPPMPCTCPPQPWRRCRRSRTTLLGLCLRMPRASRDQARMSKEPIPWTRPWPWRGGRRTLLLGLNLNLVPSGGASRPGARL